MQKPKQKVMPHLSKKDTMFEKSKIVINKGASLNSNKEKLVTHQKRGYLGR